MNEHRVYIRELAAALDRREDTVRVWCRTGRLPARLRPRREETASGTGWRYWSEDQVEDIKKWMRAERMFPGAGLKNYEPSDEEQRDLLERLRTKERTA